MTKAKVKEIMNGHYTGKIVDIDIYMNRYTQVWQATVIVVNEHMVEQYIVDESGAIYFNVLMTTGASLMIKESEV